MEGCCPLYGRCTPRVPVTYRAVPGKPHAARLPGTASRTSKRQLPILCGCRAVQEDQAACRNAPGPEARSCILEGHCRCRCQGPERAGAHNPACRIHRSTVGRKSTALRSGHRIGQPATVGQGCCRHGVARFSASPPGVPPRRQVCLLLQRRAPKSPLEAVLMHGCMGSRKPRPAGLSRYRLQLQNHIFKVWKHM